MIWKTRAIALVALLICVQANAIELKILATGSMVEPLKELGEDFTRLTGHTLTFSTGTTGVVMNKIRDGEKADVIVISTEAADILQKGEKISASTRADIANSLIGVGVKKGAPIPDISTAEAFKSAVLAARSICYPDPVLGATSGLYLEHLFDRLAIAKEAKAKAVLKPLGAEVAEAVAEGEIDLALTFISELVPNKGVTLVGPLPDAIQNPTLYTAGVASDSAHADAGRAFLAFIASPASAIKLKAAGVAPATKIP